MNDTRFMHEIREQPEALRRVADYYSSFEGRSLLKDTGALLRSKRRIIFTGMGTSLYAPYLVQHPSASLPLIIDIRDAGELLHFGLEGITADDAVAAVSQSGESAETRAVTEFSGKTAVVVSIVNDMSGTMAKHADFVLPMCAGEEASISAKTYTNTLAILMILSSVLAGNETTPVIDGLHAAADRMERDFSRIREEAARAAVYFSGMNALHVVARGSDLVTARQLALIIKEGAGIFSEALSAGLFRHGPLELAGEGHNIVFVVSDGNEPGLTAELAKETARYGSRVLLVSDREYKGGDYENVIIDTPDSRFFVLSSAPFIELFVHESAGIKGREAGVFRRISKVTSRE